MRITYQHPTQIQNKEGFTLLEVLVATSILGIALAIVLQLFSINLKAISASSEYISGLMTAEAKMRELLHADSISEQVMSEMTSDGYRIDIAVQETLADRTENLPVRLFAINMKVSWTIGSHEKSVSLNSLKTVRRELE
jgi:prepilin-type N-terminal cleavage/methylation domain-containing protein